MAAAVACLRAGGLVGLPTETVYGLAALAQSEDAVRRVFSVKGRPADHPLIVHLAQASQLPQWGRDVPEYAQRLAWRLWPGPLTLVVPKQESVPDLLTGGQDSVGLRVPSHPVALTVLTGCGPLAAPSANRFGRVSPTSAAAVAEELATHLDERDLILDGGDCAVGIESTIVDCTGGSPRVLRAGFYSDDVLEEASGVALSQPQGVGAVPRVSGSLAAHYAPRTQVTLMSAGDVSALPDSRVRTAWLLAMSSEQVAAEVAPRRATRPGTADEYARTLYATLRSADHSDVAEVIAVPPLGGGIAVAVRDRLRRASAGSGSQTAT